MVAVADLHIINEIFSRIAVIYPRTVTLSIKRGISLIYNLYYLIFNIIPVNRIMQLKSVKCFKKT